MPSLKTLDLFFERFPKYCLEYSNWPEGQAVAEHLVNSNLGTIEALYVYGLGAGAPYAQLTSWLEENEARRLIILEDDLGAIKAWLKLPIALEMLERNQVCIEAMTKDWQTALTRLAETHPCPAIDVVMLPSKKKEVYRRWKLHLMRRTTLASSLVFDRSQSHILYQNAVCNAEHLPHSFYAARLEGMCRGKPAIVCGAGPSLNDAIETLSQCDDKALLIAGGSAVAALSSRGIMPHFGIAVDPNVEEYHRFCDSKASGMPLLYSLRLHPDVFSMCSGPFGYMRSGIGGAFELWLDEALGLTEPLLGSTLSEEAISVTAMSVAWAHFLGCDPIYLAGVDLAYVGGRRYASGITHDPTSDGAVLALDRRVRRKNGEGKWVETAIRWVMEAASLAHFAGHHPNVRYYNTGLKGAVIENFPHRPLTECLTYPSWPFQANIASMIEQAKLPATAGAIVQEKLAELKASLEKTVSYLEVLAGQKSGNRILAEFDLEEELAVQLLFHDAAKTFSSSKQFWTDYLQMVLKFL
ncbi:MAG: hypothetical protein RL235_969 [Chlamydiota bacterium]